MESCLAPIAIARSFVESPDLSVACKAVLNSLQSTAPFDPVSYLESFGITLAVESPIYFYLLQTKSIPKRFQWLVLTILFTHPIAYFLVPWLASLAMLNVRDSVVVAQIFLPVGGTFILAAFAKVNRATAIEGMLVANFMSWWIVGLIFV